MLLTAFIVPANAVARTSAPTGAIVNFNMMGEMLSPRSRCKDAAKRQWKRCRERDRRANARCDWELERRRRECDRLRG
jgi:hypothetical protein